ncbi:hypothetical protein GQ457_06G028160 [Hibiscus cannabinus]
MVTLNRGEVKRSSGPGSSGPGQVAVRSRSPPLRESHRRHQRERQRPVNLDLPFTRRSGQPFTLEIRWKLRRSTTGPDQFFADSGHLGYSFAEPAGRLQATHLPEQNPAYR